MPSLGTLLEHQLCFAVLLNYCPMPFATIITIRFSAGVFVGWLYKRLRLPLHRMEFRGSGRNQQWYLASEPVAAINPSPAPSISRYPDTVKWRRPIPHRRFCGS